MFSRRCFRAHTARALFVSVLLLGRYPARSIETQRLRLEELVSSASDIVVGTVLAKRAVIDNRTNAIWTEYVLSISDTWKGKHQSERRLRVFGGELDGRSEGILGQPTLEVGISYLLFLGNLEHAFAPTIGVGQGIFRIVPVTDDGGVSDLRLVSAEGELLELTDDHLIVRTGQWRALGRALEAVEPQWGGAVRENDPDVRQSTGKPSRSPVTVATKSKPASLDQVRRFLVEPTMETLRKEHVR